MKGRRFTRIEIFDAIMIALALLLIIVPLSIGAVSIIKKSVFKARVKRVLEISKKEIKDSEINVKELKNSKFKTGKIRKTSDNKLEAYRISDSEYCASGTKEKMIVKKLNDNGTCGSLDYTPPSLFVKVMQIDNDSILVNAYGKDSQTNIAAYTFYINGKKAKRIKTNNNIVTYEFKNLKPNTKYNITVAVNNENKYNHDIQYKKDMHTTIYRLKPIKLPKLKSPEITFSEGDYKTYKEVTITYPEGKNIEKGYIVKDKEGEVVEEKEVKENIVKLKIKQSGRVRAYATDDKDEVEKSIKIIGIDSKEPEFDLVIENEDKWEKEKTLRVVHFNDSDEVIDGALDKGVGLDKKAYSFDGGKTWTNSSTYSYSVNGTYRIVVRDKVGNKSEKSIEIKKADSVPPGCTSVFVSPFPYVNGSSTNENVMIRGECYDEVGECDADPITILINEQDEMRSPGYVRDLAGNVSKCPTTLQVRIDKTPPKCGGITKQNSSWYNKDIAVGFKCIDNNTSYNSGCSYNEYQKMLTTEGEKETISTLISDKAGNIASCTYTYDKYIDKTPPKCGKISGENKKWTNKDVKIGVDCYEEGDVQSKCSQDTFTKTAACIGKESTEKIIIKDNAGNKTECENEYDVYCDQVSPKCTTLYISNAEYHQGRWVNKDITIKGECSDELGECSVEPSITLTKEQDKKYNPGVVYDKAGNKASCETKEVKIDKTSPYSGEKIGKKINWINNQKQLIGASCNDNKSGCRQRNFVRTIYNNMSYELKDLTLLNSQNIDSNNWNNNNIKFDQEKALFGYSLNSKNNLKLFMLDSNNSLSDFKEYLLLSLENKNNNINFNPNSIAGGLVPIKSRACDKAGNCTTYLNLQFIKVDTKPPTQPTVKVIKDNKWLHKGYSFVLTSIDKTSGIEHFEYTYNPNITNVGTDKYKEWIKYENSTSNTFTTPQFTNIKNKTIYFRACDKAGNCSKRVAVSVKKDDVQISSGLLKYNAYFANKSWN